MASLNFYLFSEKIACSGCVGKIETAIKKVDCNAEVNLRNISTHESRVNIETRYSDFKERFNRLHGESWVLCDTLDEYSIQKKAARYNVFFVFMVLVLGVWVAFFQPFLPVYDILICSSVFIYSSVALRVFSGQFDHGLLLAVLSMVLFVMTLVANVHGYLLGGMLCIEHFACPIFILASLDLRSFFSIVADSKMDNPVELDFLEYVKEGKNLAINEISEGDVISIRPGQLIPFDGLIKSPGDYVFNTVSTNGDTASTVSQGGNVSCGWVYSSCGGDVKIEALKVKGGVKSKDYKAKVAAVRKKRIHEKDGRSLLFLLVNLTLCFVPPISCLFLFYSFGLTSFLHMAMNLLMVFCPCSMFLARFYVGGMVANNLHRYHKELGVRVQGLSGFGSLASKKLVFCWDRTNTLTNPLSAGASVLREDVRGVIEKLIDMGCTKHYVLSGNKGDKNVESLFGESNVAFNCTPDAKHEKILELQAEGYTVAMIGDGENDLLALAQADISFGVWHSAIGYGSSLPVVTSDIVLNNKISGLPYLVAAARSSESFLNWLALFNGASAMAVAVCVIQGVVTNPIIVSSYMLGMMVLNIFLSYCYRSVGVGDVVLSSSRQDKLSSVSISHDFSLGVSNIIDLGLEHPKEKVI